MPRKKSVVPDQKHVNPIDKMKRRAQIGSRPGKPKAKPRVVAGTAAARALGIGIKVS